MSSAAAVSESDANNASAGPTSNAATVTPSDTTDLTSPTRAVYVGGAGDLTVNMLGLPSGSSVVFKAVPVGTVLPIRAARILTTGTTATNLLALW